MAPSVQYPTLDVSSGLDLRVVSSSSVLGGGGKCSIYTRVCLLPTPAPAVGGIFILSVPVSLPIFLFPDLFYFIFIGSCCCFPLRITKKINLLVTDSLPS